MNSSNPSGSTLESDPSSSIDYQLVPVAQLSKKTNFHSFTQEAPHCNLNMVFCFNSYHSTRVISWMYPTDPHTPIPSVPCICIFYCQCLLIKHSTHGGQQLEYFFKRLQDT
jgi:hypothetical protein